MQTETPNAQSAKFLAGRLCLDFVNTKSGRGAPSERERLEDYVDLLAWCARAGIVNDDQASSLLVHAGGQAGAARDALARAHGLRDALHRIFAGIVHGQRAAEGDLDVMNGVLADAARNGGIAERDGAFRWQWGREAVDSVLWPIAHSAAELLTAGRLDRIGECGGNACGWLFFDETRNHSRRWCEMDVCGNRAKARRHYRRALSGPSED